MASEVYNAVWIHALKQKGMQYRLVFDREKRIVELDMGVCRIRLCAVPCARANGLLNLKHAIELGNKELFEERLRVDDVNEGYYDPLAFAMMNRRTYMVRRLLESGAMCKRMDCCRTEEHARMLCAHSVQLAHKCLVYERMDLPYTEPLRFADLFYQAGARPCEEPTCPMRAFQGQVPTLQRQCSNLIRRNKMDMSLLPQALAWAVSAFDV